MRKTLYIIGAGGFGREVLQYCWDIPAEDRDWDLGGFLDDRKNALAGYNIDVPVVDSPTNYMPKDGDVFICAIGTPKFRMSLAEELEGLGFEFITLIHPTAKVGSRCSVGVGTVLCPGVTLTCDVTVGRHCLYNCYAISGHDSEIGDYCTLSAFCGTMGFSRLERGVYMGTHSTVIPQVRVGEFATIGGGSCVMTNVPANATYVGVPADKIYTRE